MKKLQGFLFINYSIKSPLRKNEIKKKDSEKRLETDGTQFTDGKRGKNKIIYR